MAFDIKTFNSVDFLNELEQFINEIDESGFKKNPNLDSTENKNIKEDFRVSQVKDFICISVCALCFYFFLICFALIQGI